MLAALGCRIPLLLPGQAALPIGNAMVWVVSVVAIGFVALLVGLLVLSHRQERRDLREIVRAVEDLRAGAGARPAEVDSRSPMSFLADAVNRLAEDFGRRATAAASSEERLRAVLAAARDYAVVATDGDGDVTSFSTSATDLFGWEEEEILSRQASILFDGSSWRDLLPRLTRRTFRERGIETRVRLVRKGGTEFDGHVVVRWMEGSATGVPGFLLLARDVSSQIRLEEELRESEARYRALFEGLAEGALLLQGGTIALANRAFEKMCGAGEGELSTRRFRERVAVRDLLVVEERLAALEAGECGADTLHFTLLGANGQPAAEASLHAAPVAYGGKPAVLAVVRDETAERLIQAELRQNETRLDAVLEATSDGILVLADAASGGVVRMTNRAFLDIFGLSEREVLGASEGGLIRRLSEAGAGAEAVAALLSTAARETVVERAVLEGERPRILEIRVARLEGPSGAPLGRVLACRDISDQRAFEQRLEANTEALRRSKAELEQSYLELQGVKEDLARRTREGEDLNRELKALVEMKSSLLASVSHELQTPLVSIRGYTEMILRERLGTINDEQRKGLSLALRNIDRLIAMIDNLLFFTKRFETEADLKLSVFRLGPVVQDTVDLLRPKAEQKQVAVSAVFADPAVEVRADRDKIVQVFVNLLTNAIKFNRDGGRVELSVGAGRPGFAEVQVKDTGIGIPRDELERIFDRYFQGESAKGAAERGYGIGLSLVRNILRLHGCAIRAESETGQGSTFVFALPLAGRATPEEVDSPSPPRARETTDAAESKAETDPPTETRSEAGAPNSFRPRFRIVRQAQTTRE